MQADLPGQLAEEQRLRSLLLAGAATTPAAPADGAYFEGLRERMRKAAKAAGYDAHAVPMPRPRVTLWGADARKRMEAALVEARAAMPCRVSCVIAVEEIDVRTMTASHERV